MTITGVNDDGDSLCETGEKFKVVIDFSELDMTTGVDPAQLSMDDVYAHPYENIRIELRPSTGAVLSIARQIPAVYTAIMVLE